LSPHAARAHGSPSPSARAAAAERPPRGITRSSWREASARSLHDVDGAGDRPGRPLRVRSPSRRSS
jgi:hypothetical protein